MLLLDAKELQLKAISARERVLSQYSISRLLGSTEGALSEELGYIESSPNSKDKESQHGK